VKDITTSCIVRGSRIVVTLRTIDAINQTSESSALREGTTMTKSLRVFAGSMIVVAMAAGRLLAQGGSEAAPQPMIGAAAPAFELRTVAGDTLSLADLKGKFVVLHFGASW
jgi:hypothetical protein